MTYTILEIDEHDSQRVQESHALLKEVMGTGVVEDLDSYKMTISSATDRAISPKVVGAVSEDRLIGVIVGAYLQKLGMGFIAYAAVRDEWQGHGVYGSIRSRLIGQLKESHSINFLISELDEDDWLIDKYVNDWKAIPLPCTYEQPAVQGLQVKPLRLVLTPLVQSAKFNVRDTLSIIGEVYRRIYRISNPEENVSFRRIRDSLNSTSTSSKPL